MKMGEKKSYQKKIKTRILAAALCLLFAVQVFPAYAKPSWPSDVGIEAGGGIVVDMDTGAVLFGRNIHVAYPPASITKLLTALLVVENCDSLDEMVTFSHDAVYNVESGSSNPTSVEVGDQLSVRDCLYALLLRSSNQTANALAEYVAERTGTEGGRDGFVTLMNERIRQIGCTESNFANPSGLNDDNQYVTAYDMALIGCEVLRNETIMEINSAVSYDLPPTYHNPEGLTIYMEHKLLVTTDPASPNYYPAAVAGKTGYTSLALNTLVTRADDQGKRLVAVVLKSQQTHYPDTISLLNFGFQRFQNLDATGDELSLFGSEDELVIGTETYSRSDLEVWGNRLVTVPLGATLADVECQLVTGEAMTPGYPENTVAEIRYTYDDRVVGKSYFVKSEEAPEELTEAGTGEDGSESSGSEGEGAQGSSAADSKDSQNGEKEDTPASQPQITLPFHLENRDTQIKAGIAVLGAVLLLSAGIGIPLKVRKVRRERIRLEEQRKEKRRQRLADIGYSEKEFQNMVEKLRDEKPD